VFDVSFNQLSGTIPPLNASIALCLSTFLTVLLSVVVPNRGFEMTDTASVVVDDVFGPDGNRFSDMPNMNGRDCSGF
jgi:hypothetical protein